MTSYEDALMHAQKIEEIQRRKQQNGGTPTCPLPPKNDGHQRLFRKLKNRLKMERVREITKHPERRISNQGERHRQPIQCIETGEIFHSVKELAEQIGVTSATICIQIERKRKIRGYTYTKITKEDEKNAKRK